MLGRSSTVPSGASRSASALCPAEPAWLPPTRGAADPVNVSQSNRVSAALWAATLGLREPGITRRGAFGGAGGPPPRLARVCPRPL